jgi:hypothetical protein
MALLIPTIPTPSDTPASVYETLMALKQSSEAMNNNLPAKQTTAQTAAAHAVAVAITTVKRLNG